VWVFTWNFLQGILLECFFYRGIFVFVAKSFVVRNLKDLKWVGSLWCFSTWKSGNLWCFQDGMVNAEFSGFECVFNKGKIKENVKSLLCMVF
jgi:hypothetical protein